MINKTLQAWLFFVIAISVLPACGGGGGGGTDSGNAAAPLQPTSAIVRLITAGTGTTIYGIDVTVDLPAGVTLKSAVNPPSTDAGVVIASGATGSASIVTAVYTAATSTQPAKARIGIVNANGFSSGEYCAVNADIAAGHSPQASDFSMVNFQAWDGLGGVISGITPSFTVETR